jgi:hypothetical protein
MWNGVHSILIAPVSVACRGLDSQDWIRGRGRMFLFSTTSWLVNKNEIWLVRTFINVETVTEDFEIDVSW